jgi:hypothetical protein
MSLILWNPALTIDKNATYLIDPDDFIGKIVLTPYTVFHENGLYITVSGLRLSMLLKTPSTTTTTTTATTTQLLLMKKKSKKNVCFINNSMMNVLNSHINTPLCIKKITQELMTSSRNGMYRKRFIWNCYILNVLTCVKCSNKCLLEAMTIFYKGETKCVNEVLHLMVKSQNAYKPPNCEKMKNIDKLCPYAGMCKGLNPICNF